MPALSLPRRIGRAASRVLLRPANSLLHRLETSPSADDDALATHPPILLIGPPRSGSTLLYQLIVEAFELGYLSNLHEVFYGAPSLISKMVRPSRHRPTPTYRSQHGRVAHWSSPSESGDFWYRFFRRRPQAVTLADSSAAQREALRRSVAQLTATEGRPIVFKNLVCALRLAPIAAALPEARYVVIERDLQGNVDSIVKSRERVLRDPTRWWSVEPTGFEAWAGLPPSEQAAHQVRAILQTIAADAGDIGEDRFCRVDYGQLCAEPHAVLGSLGDFFRASGGPVERREGASIPGTFARPASAGLEAGA